MRVAHPVPDRVPVGLDHRQRMLHDPDHVALVHGVVDGAEPALELQLDGQRDPRLQVVGQAAVGGVVGQRVPVPGLVGAQHAELDA